MNGGRLWLFLLPPTEADLCGAVLLLSLKTGTFGRSLFPPTETEPFVAVLLPPTEAGLFGSRTFGTSPADFTHEIEDMHNKRSLAPQTVTDHSFLLNILRI